MNPKSPVSLVLALLAFGPGALAQSTWYVDGGGTPPGDGSAGNPYTSLQFCIAQGSTVDGDTVLVAPGTYVEDLDLLGKSLDVRGTAGASQTILRPASATSAVKVVGVASARLEGFTIRQGSGTSDGTHTRGGAVYCSASTLVLDACELLDSQASLGGNLCAQDGADVTLIECLLQGGKACEGSGAYVAGSTLVAHDTAIRDNDGNPSASCTNLDSRGVGLCAAGGAVVELFRCDLSSNNKSFFRGGGLYHDGSGTTLLEECTVSGNGGLSFSSSWGGGAYAAGPGLQFVRCRIDSNSALFEGGGVRGGQLLACDVLGNGASYAGGVYGASLEGCRVVGNSNYNTEDSCAGPGGGAHSSTLVRCVLEDNFSNRQGAGAYNSTLVECEVLDNLSSMGSNCSNPASGGGIYGGSATDCVFRGNVVKRSATSMTEISGGAAANATLTRCLLEDNRVDGGTEGFWGDWGGGAYGCQLVDCTLIGNRCVGAIGNDAPKGGGMYGGTATGCVFIGNSVETTAGGPLAAGGGAASATLTRCVLVGNTADHGGAAWKCDLSRCSTYGNVATQAGGGLSVHPTGVALASETIFWGNLPDELDPGMGVITARYCDVAGGYPGLGNIDADPEYWSGTAADLHLRPGSPCIGAGDPTLPPDPDGSAREIGAFPFDADYTGGPYFYCAAKTTSEGCVPEIGFSGSPTLSGPDDFFVEAALVPANQNGLLFWGNAPASAPFNGGLRCVATPVVRTPVSSSGGSGACGGVFSFHFTQGHALGAGIAAGDRIFAQYWFRDPAQPDGTGVGLSGGLDLTWLP